MKIIFLGTNGWYTNENGNTACILIDTKDHYIIFDAGNGIYNLDHYITEEKPISLFISHFHLDHVNGLHVLGKFRFSKGLDIYVGKNRKKDFDTLVSPPFTIGTDDTPENIAKLSLNVRVHELNDGENHLSFPVSCLKQFHAYTDHGYRIKIEGKTIAYSGDCKVTDASYPLARDADILIHECSSKDPLTNDLWGHTDPIGAATLAKDVHVKKLLLTHFDPTNYPTLADRKAAEEKARKIFENTTAAVDRFTLEI